VRTIILILSLMLVGAIELERRQSKLIGQTKEGIQKARTGFQWFRTTKTWKVLVVFSEVFSGAFVLAQGVVTLWGPFWPTKPDVQFHDTVDASSFVLPFKLTNRSVLFSIENADITCGVDLLYFIDANKRTGILRDAIFKPGPISIGRDGDFTNFPCTAADYIKVRNDGSALLGFENGQNLTSPPAAFRAPLTVLKMCLWISGNYSVFGFATSFKSKMFQWPAAPGQRQWIEGPIIPDLPNEAWIPPDGHTGPVWAPRNIMLPDKSGYLPGALQCTRMQ
jgi:hypothetical protein